MPVFARAEVSTEKESLAGASSSKNRINLIVASGNQGTYVRRKIAVAGVVSNCLTQLGDCNLVLNLLGPSIQQELVSSELI